MVHTRFSSASPSISEGPVSRKLKFSPHNVKGKKLKKSPVKLKKSPVKLKKSTKFMCETELFARPQGMVYDIPVQNHQSAKITTLNKYEPITDLMSLLSKEQLTTLSHSCFGHFLNMPHFKIQHQLIHNLLIRQLKQPNPNELWLGLGGITMKFGLEEFATVTGLLCVGTSDKMRFSKSENSIVTAYYEGNNSVAKSALKNTVFGKKWKTDGDAVKLAKLYLLHHFLLTSNTDCQIPKGDLDLVDSDGFDKYPWGKEVFKLTIDSLKHHAKTTSKDNYYRLIGLPYALQVWFYECCPYMNGKYCDRIRGSIPRVLNWTSDYTAKFGEVYTTLSLDAKELQLTKFTPSATELKALQLKELSVKPSAVAVGCNEILTNDSDDDFVSPAPSPLTRAAASSVPSKDKVSLTKIQIQMRKLEASQRKLKNEVKDLKCIVNDHRTYFDLELSKLRDTLLTKVPVGNDACDKVNSEANDEANQFDNVLGEEEVSPRIVDDITNSPNVVETCATDAVGVGNDQEYESEPILSGDFSPETMEKVESFVKEFDNDSNQERTNLVADVEYELQKVAAVATNGEKVAETAEDVIKEFVTTPDMMASAEAYVLQVAREISEDTVPSDTMVEMGNAFKNSMDVEMKDAGGDKSKAIVLRDVESGPSGLVKVTPALPKRGVKLPAYLCSPFLQHFGSSAQETTEPTPINNVKGITPLDSDIGNLPTMEQSSDYYIWLEKGLSMKATKKKFYSKEDNEISPPMKFGCEIISEKTWFHTIEYGSNDLSISHVNAFFYYLRKMSKSRDDCQIKFTTSDCKLQKAIASFYVDVSESDNIQSKLTAKRGILDDFNGVALPFSTPWYMVDYVFVPIWLEPKKYWVLAVINLKQRHIRVWNTVDCDGISSIARKALLPLSKILTHHLLLTEFYSRADINFSGKSYADKPKTDCFKTTMHNVYSCEKSVDSGVAMLAIAEYLVLYKEFQKDSFDIAGYRSRISFSFYAYGMAKLIYSYESKHEYFDDGRGDAVAKRTRAGRVQTRKRNLGNACPNRKKEKKG